MSKRLIYPFEKPIASQFSTPSGVLCVQVMIPDAPEHIALMQGLLAAPTKEGFWDGTDSENAALAAKWENTYTLTDWQNCLDIASQYELTVWQILGTVLVGSAFIVGTLAGTYDHIRQNPSAINDQFYIPVRLAKGNYTIKMVYFKANSGGQQTWQVQYSGGVVLQTFAGFIEYYSAATVLFNLQTYAMTIPTDGEYWLYSQVGSRNAGSSSYNTFTSLITLTKTS